MKKAITALFSFLLVLVLALRLSPLCGTASAESHQSSAQFHGISPTSWTDIRQILTSYSYVIGLRYDGSVLYWGDSDAAASEVASWTGIRELVRLDYDPNALLGLRGDGTVISTINLDLSSWHSIKKAVGISNWDICWVAGLASDGTVFTAHRDIPPEESAYISYDWLESFPSGPFSDIFLHKGWTAMSGLVALRADQTVYAADTENMLGYVQSWKNIVGICDTLDYIYGLRADGMVETPSGADQLGFFSSPSEWTNVKALYQGFQDDLLALTDDGRILGATVMEDVAGCLLDAQHWPAVSDILDIGCFDLIASGRDGQLLCSGTIDTDIPNAIDHLKSWHGLRSIHIEYDYIIGLKTDGTLMILGDLPQS